MHTVSKIRLLIIMLAILNGIAAAQPKIGIIEIPPREPCGYFQVYVKLFADESEIKKETQGDVWFKGISDYVIEHPENKIIEKLYSDSTLLTKIANQLNERFVYSKASEFVPGFGDQSFHLYDIELRNAYFFSNNPDIVIGKYYTPPSTHLGDQESRYYIYLARADTAILIDEYEIRIKGVESIYNYLVKNSGDLAELNILCKAAFILSMKYRFHTIYILESELDFRQVGALAAANYLGVPIDVVSADELFINDVSMVENWIPDWQQYTSDSDSIYQILKDSIPLHSANIVNNNGNTKINMTIFCKEYQEIAEWEIIFNDNEKLISLTYARKPICTLGELYHRSPYKIDFEN